MTIHIAEGIQLSPGANICMNGGTIQCLAAPINDTDAAIKATADEVQHVHEMWIQPNNKATNQCGSTLYSRINCGIFNSYTNFYMPYNFHVLCGAQAFVMPIAADSTGSDKSITWCVSYGTVGECYCHYFCCYTGSYDFGACSNWIQSFDISEIFTGISANNYVSILATFNCVTITINGAALFGYAVCYV